MRQGIRRVLRARLARCRLPWSGAWGSSACARLFAGPGPGRCLAHDHSACPDLLQGGRVDRIGYRSRSVCPGRSPTTRRPIRTASPTSPSQRRSWAPAPPCSPANCSSCHGPEALGTQRAPNLQGLGAGTVDFWVSTGRMPLANTERRRPSASLPSSTGSRRSRSRPGCNRSPPASATRSRSSTRRGRTSRRAAHCSPSPARHATPSPARATP